MDISPNDLFMQVEKIRDHFIIKDTRLPERVNEDHIIVVGFADECHVRQSPAFFDAFRDFLLSTGDGSFFFLWLQGALDVTDASYGLSVHSLAACKRPTNFVRLQKTISDEVLSGEAWFISSLTGLWAIYGEQYGSELSVFLANDHGIAKKIGSAFKTFLTDSVGAANGLGDPSETSEGRSFNGQLIENYSAKK